MAFSNSLTIPRYRCQSLVTATAYTVVGVMNKTLTVLANALVWDKHASAVGLCSLTVCLAGGTLYQQASTVWVWYGYGRRART